MIAGVCQNPDCELPGRRVSFRDAEIHHVVEHTAGGPTVLQNGVLICPVCHRDRSKMQSLTGRFQEYLGRIYVNPMQAPLGGVATSERAGTGESQGDSDDDVNENGAPVAGTRLKIAIDWGALDVDRETQIISGGPASDMILKLLVELIREFGDHMKQQLTELPVIAFPLSRNPATDFLNRAKGKPYGSLPVPDTDLFFCPHSDTETKVIRLRRLFSRLILPDGSDFPPGSVEVSIEGEQPEPTLL